MDSTGVRGEPRRTRTGPLAPSSNQWSADHFARLAWHRRWLAFFVFIGVSLLTAAITSRLPDIYTSETLILVDPQKVPDSYIRSTVTGDVRNRLGTLSQQILSATRLQKIIEDLNLYPEERLTMAREEVIARMRRDISVLHLTDYGPNQELQAFRISYSGRDPVGVAKVTNQLASLFIDENLKAREQQATGTTEFLENQLVETRKALETQEGKLRDFKLRHVGSMPEQETASLQILGQLQSQLQLESEALARAEQQKSYLQSMIAAAPPPVVDLDGDQPHSPIPAAASPAAAGGAAAPTSLARLRERLKASRARYSDQHPEVKKLLRQVEEEEAKQSSGSAGDAPAVMERPAVAVAETAAPVRRRAATSAPAASSNPVLETQLRAVQTEIEQHKVERERLAKSVGSYQQKLAAIPVNEQLITALERDYEISKAHYKELLAKQLSAATATQLEVRQKGEKFSVLDPAQPAEKPSRPNRRLLNLAGCLAGLVFGLMAALLTEALGPSITAPEQLTASTGIAVLEVIPVIETQIDRDRRWRQAVIAAGAGVLLSGLLLIVYLVRLYQTGS